MAGSQPGHERWIVWLRDRSFDLRRELREIRALGTANERSGRVALLEGMAAADQRALATLVQGGGGTVDKHFWTLSALSVDVPRALLPQLRAHPRVRALFPVRARSGAEMPMAVAPSGAVLPPIDVSTDPNNHNVARARAIIQNSVSLAVSEGAGARIAFFDTGIDVDEGGGNPHRAFVQPAPNQGLSRIEASLRAGLPAVEAIDCNNISVEGLFDPIMGPPTPPFSYRPCVHSGSAPHGTGMAGIACGNTFTAAGDALGSGHAPRASIIDISITKIPPIAAPYGANTAFRDRWFTDDLSMLNAVQLLTAEILANNNAPDVLSISFQGWSDPLDPVSAALDQFARDFDVLLVTSAGNTADETRQSHGFYNGLAVGSVHGRLGPAGSFVPMAQTSRGPLSSDTRRYYPDVCATGAGPGLGGGQFPIQYGNADDSNARASMLRMPQIDLGDPCALVGTGVQCQPTSLCSAPFVQPPAFPPPFGLPIPGGAIRFNIGTSEAAAQVSGAAALYRATRASASADETRAAVLLNVLSPYVGTYTGGTGHQQHSYTGRNTFGVGYVRDDLLAEFAVRGLPNAPDIKALHSTVPLAQLGVDAVIPYTGLVAGRRYAVAIAWPRIFFDADEFVALANVDVEVRLNGSMIARSASPANSYERLAFTMPEGATAVDIVVRLGDVPWWFPNLVGFGTVLVHVVAREFEPDFDTTTPAFEPTPVHASTGLVESLPPAAQGQCTGPAWDLTPVRTVPLDYAQAYGSMAVNLTPVLSSPANFAPPGYTRGLNLRTGANTGPGGRSMHFEISGSTSPEFPFGRVGAPMTIGGIAFRTWRPFAVSGSLAVTITMGSTAAGPVDQNSLLLLSSAVPGAIDVVSTTLPGVSADWVARGYDEFPIVVPFTTPFVYNGGNLHVWMTIGTTTAGSYVVDAIEDGATPNYGALIATPGVSSWFIESGKCPVIALLPAAPAPPLPNLQPLLRVFGEPMVGSSLELQIMHAPANSGVFVTFALTWQPGASMVGNCMQHIAAPFSSLFIPTGAAGFARMPVTFGLNANLIHGTMGIQALVLPPSSSSTLSNALRLTIGGAL